MLKVFTYKCGQKNINYKKTIMMTNKIIMMKIMKKMRKLHYLIMNKLILEKLMNFYYKKANQVY